MDNEAERVYKLMGLIFTGVSVAIIAASVAAAITDLSLAPLMMMLMAVPFLGVGVGFLKHTHDKRETENDVIEMGCTVDAVTTDIQPDLSISVNGRHPWMITASYEDTQAHRVYHFGKSTTPDQLDQTWVNCLNLFDVGYTV